MAKKNYQIVTLETKLLVVDQILNGQISTNFASKKYDIPRITINYWLRKYNTLVQKNNDMSKLDEIKKQIDQQRLITMIKDYRKKVGSKTGGIKLYSALKQDFINADIKIGRDQFYRFLRLHKLLVPKTKNYITTTNSNHRHRKYKNLVKDHVPNRPKQLWVSDITYIKIQRGHHYLALVTDAYSKKIMGYKLDDHMRTSLCTDALSMAIKNRKYPNLKLIHHSDKGLQYCSPKYTGFAESNGIKMSMTEQYDPYENAVAERINRTLKYEYGLKQIIKK